MAEKATQYTLEELVELEQWVKRELEKYPPGARLRALVESPTFQEERRKMREHWPEFLKFREEIMKLPPPTKESVEILRELRDSD